MTTLLFFGKLSDIVSNRTITLPDAVKDTQALVKWLGREDALLGEALAEKGISIAVNAEMVRGAHPIRNGDEIAFMSPVSGG